MLSVSFQVFVNFVLWQLCHFVYNFLASLLAHIAVVVLLSVVFVQSILVVESFALTKLALGMVLLLMLYHFVIFEDLLLVGQHWLELNAYRAMVHMVIFVQMIVECLLRVKFPRSIFAKLTVKSNFLENKVFTLLIFKV